MRVRFLDAISQHQLQLLILHNHFFLEAFIEALDLVFLRYLPLEGKGLNAAFPGPMHCPQISCFSFLPISLALAKC